MNKNSVARKLEARPEPEEIEKRGLMQGGVARSIQGIQRRLSHNMTTDKLGHLLEKRPDLEDLKTAGIVNDPSVAPSIQANQKKLERNLAKSNLYHALSHRPSIDELVDAGQLNEDYDPFPFVEHEELEEDLQRRQEEAEYQRYMEEQQAYYDAYDEYDEPDAYTYAEEFLNRHRSNQGYYDEDDEEYDPTYYPEEDDYEDAGEEEEEEDELDEEDYEDDTLQSLHQRRSKNFHLTRLLLKHISVLSQNGDIDHQQKSVLKDLTVDQDSTILAVAEAFDANNDLSDFQDSLVRLTYRWVTFLFFKLNNFIDIRFCVEIVYIFAAPSA